MITVSRSNFHRLATGCCCRARTSTTTAIVGCIWQQQWISEREKNNKNRNLDMCVSLFTLNFDYRSFVWRFRRAFHSHLHSQMDEFLIQFAQRLCTYTRRSQINAKMKPFFSSTAADLSRSPLFRFAQLLLCACKTRHWKIIENNVTFDPANAENGKQEYVQWKPHRHEISFTFRCLLFCRTHHRINLIY